MLAHGEDPLGWPIEIDDEDEDSGVGDDEQRGGQECRSAVQTADIPDEDHRESGEEDEHLEHAGRNAVESEVGPGVVDVDELVERVDEGGGERCGVGLGACDPGFHDLVLKLSGALDEGVEVLGAFDGSEVGSELGVLNKR